MDYEPYNAPRLVENGVKYFLNETLNNFATLNNLPIFYYEDLYYGNFNSLFNELEIEYNQLYYKEFLDTTNKYRIGDVIVKKTNTLI